AGSAASPARWSARSSFSRSSTTSRRWASGSRSSRERSSSCACSRSARASWARWGARSSCRCETYTPGMANPYDIGLDRNPANYAPLTPLTFLEWSAAVYPRRLAVVHGGRRFSWAETYARCRRLASALVRHGVGLGDTVAVVASNTPEMYECHFGVPMTGAVLNTINTRLDAEAIAFMLEHGAAKVLLV